MRFLVLLFAAFAFASITETDEFAFKNDGDICFDDADIVYVDLYSGNATISATILPNRCYHVVVEPSGVIVTGENTNLAIQDGEIVSLITNDEILNFGYSSLITYNSEIVFNTSLRNVNIGIIILSVVSSITACLIICVCVITIVLQYKDGYCDGSEF